MEDDLKFLKNEDDLNFSKNEDDLEKNEKGRRPQQIWKWKTTSKNLKIEDDLKKFENGRRPQFFEKGRRPKKLKWMATSIFTKWKTSNQKQFEVRLTTIITCTTPYKRF